MVAQLPPEPATAVAITDANSGGIPAASVSDDQSRRSRTGVVASWTISRKVTSSAVKPPVIIGAHTTQPMTTAEASSGDSQRTATSSPPTVMASPIASPASTGRYSYSDVAATASR